MTTEEMKAQIAKELLGAIPQFNDTKEYQSGVTFKNEGNCYSLFHLSGGHYLDMSKFEEYFPEYHTFLFWALGLESSAKDAEIAELKAEIKKAVDWNMQTMSNRERDKELVNSLRSEIERLREGIEAQIKDIDRMQKGGHRTPFIVFRGRLRALLENPGAGENPTAVDNSM